MWSKAIVHMRMSISLLPRPIVLKAVSSFASLVGRVGPNSEYQRERCWPGALVWAWDCFPHYKPGSQNQDVGRECPTDSPVGMNTAPLTLQTFFCTSVSSFINICLASELFMSVFVFSHEIVNF